MFGYVKTDPPNLYLKDIVLYKSLYCGLCKSIGGTCGQCGRLALNYDLTFLSAFFHNILGTDVTIEKKRCVIHWLRRREIARRNEITDRIACLNIILAYHKLNDDVIDDRRGRGKRGFFKGAFKRAVKREPKLNEIVGKNYNKLLEYEKTGGCSADIAADPFGNMLTEISRELLADKATEVTDNICYNLGKWIYLIDALDDFDKDKKKKRYNPLVIAYPDCATRAELMQKYETETEYMFGTVLGAIAADAQKIKYEFNHDLTDNILRRGLAVKTKQVMEGKKTRRKDAGKL